MQTISIESKDLQSFHFQQFAEIIRKGGVVAFPTETVYGLGVDHHNEKAIRNLYRLKKRPLNHPMILHLSDLSLIKEVARNIPSLFYSLAKVFWPGPLTIILKKQPYISNSICKGETVAVRIPAHPVASALIKAVGGIIVGTSANLSGAQSPISAKEVKRDFEGRIDVIIVEGITRYKSPSTIIRLTNDDLEILREGPISKEELFQVR